MTPDRMPPAVQSDLEHRFDVVIAGAGPSGSALAISLAGRGVHVALIDAAKFPRQKLCGEYLSPEGRAALERLGLSRELQSAKPQEIDKVRLTTPRGRTLEAQVCTREGYAGLGLSRSVMDGLMVQKAKEIGVEVFESTRVSTPIVAGGRVLGVSGRHPERGTLAIRGRLTVAADGRHSALVRQTGRTIVLSRWRPKHFGLKRHLEGLSPEAAEPVGTVGLHLLPGGYVGTCRVEGGSTNLCGLLPEALSRNYRGNLDALAESEFDRNPVLAALWRSGRPTGPWKTVAGVRIERSSPELGGIFYVGDCRGTVDPLGGQGMTMALLGAETLAPTLLKALLSGQDPNLGQLLRDYESTWQRRFDRRIRLCRLFHHALVNAWTIDLATLLGRFGPWLLAAGYRQTRAALVEP